MSSQSISELSLGTIHVLLIIRWLWNAIKFEALRKRVNLNSNVKDFINYFNQTWKLAFAQNSNIKFVTNPREKFNIRLPISFQAIFSKTLFAEFAERQLKIQN